MAIKTSFVRGKKGAGSAVDVWCAPAVDHLVPAASSKRLREAAGKMLRAVGVRQYQLSIACLTGAAMRRLNREHLGHDYVTDVVTFDLAVETPEGTLHGEICICPAEARRNARQYGEPFERELLRYVAHGILHLAGWSDKTDKLRSAMRDKENQLLERLT